MLKSAGTKFAKADGSVLALFYRQTKRAERKGGSEMAIQKTLQALAFVAVFVITVLAFHFALQAGERNECEAWQHHPELWVEWRVEQCRSVGAPLPVVSP
jgi:Na+/alanine symporter